MRGTLWHDKKEEALNKKPFVDIFLIKKMRSFAMDHFHGKSVGPVTNKPSLFSISKATVDKNYLVKTRN